MNKTKVIGITGSIGSGKTSVAKYIESIGHTVIYTDKLAILLGSFLSGVLGYFVLLKVTQK